ncbi:MAG: ribonuclease R [Eggerthellaceae bacterium]|nr:ribonuclease R [Eggerthellaceae bacterium]
MGRSRSNTRRTASVRPRGTLSVKRGGYGFVQTAEGEYFIPAGRLNGAFDGDLVEVSPRHQERSRKALAQAASSSRKREARIVNVIERAHAEVVGRFEAAEPFGVVVPEDPGIPYDIFTLLSECAGVPDGAIVRVAMTTYPSRREAATGVIVEVLGDRDDERVPIDLIVARYKLETAFSAAALEEAAVAEVDGLSALSAGYRDVRDRVVFTIDPADARDFDDAVSIDCIDGKRRLGVHIADVAHYVPWASSIDLDARRRATSVYLVDRVVPMLPEALSNDICSLRPHETRRTMTVDMMIDEDGRIVDVDIYPALIRSCARLTYDEAQECIDGDGAEIPNEIAERVSQLSSLAKKRMALREIAGGIDFDTVEAKVRLDDEGAPVDIVLRKRTDATQLIEEAMIAANEAVACFLRDRGFPCIYRVHEKPSRESLSGLVPVLQEFSWFKGVDVDAFVAGNPHAIGHVLEACQGRNEGPLVTTLVLRAMKRAVYSPDLDGHYALASDAYAHFTSPIRRYPDLVVHRMLKAALNGKPEKFDQEVSNLGWIAEHSSEMERTAERAARDSQEVKIIELLERHVGERFSAMIAGVASYGLFVRLDNTAEGMIDIDDLGHEYFALDPVRHTLTGSDTGKQYRLGKRIAVRLVEADHRTRALRFKLV